MNNRNYLIDNLKNLISKEEKIISEIVKLNKTRKNISNSQEKKIVDSQEESLRLKLKSTIEEIYGIMDDMKVIKSLPRQSDIFAIEIENNKPPKNFIVENKLSPINNDRKTISQISTNEINHKMSNIDKKTLKRIKKKTVIHEQKKDKKANAYVSFANRLFDQWGKSLSKKEIFSTLNNDLIKSNLQYIPSSYISVTILTTLISFFIGILILIFLMMFSIGIDFPIVTMAKDSIGLRFLKFFWVVFAVPIITFLSMYIYPSVEKAYNANKINQELTLATIHMAAISGSMVEPSKIFRILISTGEYPFLQKEFTKLINEINVYGFDIVTSLRNIAFNSPSEKLTELLNGIATTIESGGSLVEFFEKRSQTLLFEYKIDREKYTKGAETFMDIYISIVIAAPMIIMLLLIMMSISGLGINLSPASITLIMVLGVTMINILFLTFLSLKQNST